MNKINRKDLYCIKCLRATASIDTIHEIDYHNLVKKIHVKTRNVQYIKRIRST